MVIFFLLFGCLLVGLFRITIVVEKFCLHLYSGHHMADREKRSDEKNLFYYLGRNSE